MADKPDEADPMAVIAAQMEEFERKSAEITELIESVGVTREELQELAEKNGIQRTGARFRRAEAGDFFTEPQAPKKPKRVRVRL